MTGRTHKSPYTCGYCPWGDHHRCGGGPCQCAAQNHRPDDAVAAGMMAFLRPDLGPWTNIGAAAERWRRNDAARNQGRPAPVANIRNAPAPAAPPAVPVATPPAGAACGNGHLRAEHGATGARGPFCRQCKREAAARHRARRAAA